MDKTIKITIRNKIASRLSGNYVCGNSDFVAVFDFDEDWENTGTKTARFSYNGTYIDRAFTGDSCPVPVISGTYSIKIGVYAGNLNTTTPAYVPAKKSILCEGGLPADPEPDVYAQLMDMIRTLNDGNISEEDIQDAVNKYLENNPIIDEDDLQTAINSALEQAKESGEFDGAPGKDGKDGLSWIDLGTVDDVMAEMDNLLEDGRYRLWSDDPFCYSVEVERVGDYIGQTHWSTEEGRGNAYFRTAYYNGEEWEWAQEWTPHVTQDWLNQYALKTHKHRQAMNADFDNWIETFREGQYQINVQAESKSYIVDQFVFNNKPISTIHVCQRYFEVSEPWKVYTRHGTTSGNYVLVDWDEWSTVGALTETDKEDIASMVIQQLPIYQGEVESV